MNTPSAVPDLTAITVRWTAKAHLQHVATDLRPEALTHPTAVAQAPMHAVVTDLALLLKVHLADLSLAVMAIAAQHRRGHAMETADLLMDLLRGHPKSALSFRFICYFFQPTPCNRNTPSLPSPPAHWP